MKQKHPDWALKFRGKGKELRCIRGRYYLYEYHNKYDPILKRGKKVTGRCLGRITKEFGFIESPQKTTGLLIGSRLEVFEYGISAFILSRTNRLDILKKHFPEDWKIIICLAYCRFAFQSPIKRMADYICSSYLSEYLNIHDISEKKVRSIILELGKNRSHCVDYMKEFIKGKSLLIDATDAAYNSNKSFFSQLGYNADNNYRPQFNLLYIYSTSLDEASYYKLIPGDIRDIKALKQGIVESGVQDVTIIGDKGFYSKENIDAFKKENLNFIIPLKRNSSLLNYDDIRMGPRFKYMGEPIWYKKIKTSNGDSVFAYLNMYKKAVEEKDYLNRVDNEELDEYNFEGFQRKESSFGTISLITNKTDSAEEIYLLYKTRLIIEQSFDFLKNILKIDGPGLHSTEMLNGWMFLNHLALQWIYDILRILKEKKLLQKTSIEDVLSVFKRTYKTRINGTLFLSELTTKNTQLYQQFGINIA